MSSAEDFKTKGNKFYLDKDYIEAVKWYSEGLRVDPKNYVLWSNVAAAHIGMNMFDVAIDDCNKSIQANAKWIKGYYRQAQAFCELKLYEKALDTVQKGLREVPSDADLLRKLQEVKQEQAEYNRTRLKGPDRKPLHPAYEAKELGNENFKKSLFEKAIEFYSRGIQSVPENDIELKCNLLNNRAACYKQLHNFKGVIGDCTEVLKHEPNNVKSLMRRGFAYEGTEKWKEALEDMTKARELDPSSKQAADAVNRIKKLIHNYT